MNKNEYSQSSYMCDNENVKIDTNSIFFSKGPELPTTVIQNKYNYK